MIQNAHESPNTKTRILNAAEALFAEHGFNGTSIRDITRRANVSLALINYHFGSKESLMREVFSRLIIPINEERLRRFDQLERRYGTAPAPIEAIVRAVFEPFYEQLKRFPELSKLVNFTVSKPREVLQQIFRRHFLEINQRSIALLRRSLPELDEETLYYRMHFSISMLTCSLATAERLRLISGGRCDPEDMDRMLEEMVAFTVASMQGSTQEAIA